MRKFLVLALLVTGFISGCTSIAAYRATDSACRKENVRCGRTPTDERNFPAEAARKGLEVDRRMAAKVIDSLASDEPAPPPYLATNEESCPEGLLRVCTSTDGCACEPQEDGVSN